MTLTEFFLSLQNVDRAYNKYATFSLSFNNPYRICTSYDAFKYEKFDNYLKNWLAEQGKVIAMPNMVNGEVTAILFRSITSKIFRYYNECPYIPYGAGVNNKQDYSRPWLIVESALDSDFLRNFYPYVIATNGTTVSNNNINFIKGTCSTCLCGFDSDSAGEEAFHRLCSKHSGQSKDFHIKRFRTPLSFDGKPLKDFGEILDCLHTNNMQDYDYYVMSVRNSLMYV